MSKLGLVLGAGGARGIAHLGLLKALEENGIVPDLVVGCSMGAIVGALYCMGKSSDELIDLAVGIKKKDVVDVTLKVISNKALLKSEKIDKIFDELFGDITFERLKIPFYCVANDILNCKEVFFGSGKLKDAVRASIAIPTIIKPVERDGMVLIDGGAVNRLPIGYAREMGADKVIAMDVIGRQKRAVKLTTVFDVALRCLDCLDGYITDNKLKACPADVLLCPDLKDMSPYKFNDIDKAPQIGYECAMQNIEKIKSLEGEKDA